jgi:hypothetical protein
MRTYWSVIFSVARRVRRALFAFCHKILRLHTKAGFTSNPTASKQLGKAVELPGWVLVATSEDLSQLSDVLAVFQRRSDRRRLGIKNEMDEKDCLVLSVTLQSFRKQAGML